MKYKNIVKTLSIAAVIIAAGVIPTYAQSWNLVDSGKHLDWDGDSQYLSEIVYAQEIWNDYKPGVIRTDTVLTLTDVWISDTNKRDGSTIAFTSPSGKICFIVPKMKECGYLEKENVALHEIGHALGLDHVSNKYYPDSVMRPNVTENDVLSDIDRVLYDVAYDTYGYK